VAEQLSDRDELAILIRDALLSPEFYEMCSCGVYAHEYFAGDQ